MQSQKSVFGLLLFTNPTLQGAKLLCFGVLIFSLCACSSIQAAKNPDSGEVLLRLVIDEKGRVANIEVLKAEPAGYFEESAVKKFREAKFSPAIKDGVPVRSTVEIRLKFEATGAARSDSQSSQ